ncbi:hypothetical protein U472_09730 [Orenia metallireducens]|uniref:Apea-like HEPN domain-containing protein n=1 Tax=Orenia metallireducens TaxID=1413210 RepID=A0A1C0A7T4_9FIRM|nr:hypothetical protein [Orenia metallireducens]OCL26281.1 hypothetical protein U472_09730 [Orenia metallireducens]
MEVKFKSIYSVHELFLNGSKPVYEFWVNKGKEKEVQLVLHSENKTDINAYRTVEITKELYDELNSKNFNYNKLSSKEQNELKNIFSVLRNATSEFLYTTKHMLDWYQLGENQLSSKRQYWLSKDEWIRIGTPITAEVNVYPKFNISPFTEKYIQKSLEGNCWTPFIAFNHLHKAKKDTDIRYKWIHATIAAELAIKEFYIQFKPELESLLLEMPSPPLRKLYGKILEEYSGERSPYVSEIHKGVSIRNKLIHRPVEKLNIDKEKVEEYIQIIEKAIFHLISLCYGEDKLIKEYLE